MVAEVGGALAASAPVEVVAFDAAVAAVVVALEVAQDPDLGHWPLFPQTGHRAHGQSPVVEDPARVPRCGEDH
jgi:hypothetical protein